MALKCKTYEEPYVATQSESFDSNLHLGLILTLEYITLNCSNCPKKQIDPVQGRWVVTGIKTKLLSQQNY